MSTNETAAATPQGPPPDGQQSGDGAPKSFVKGQTVCNEKNEKGKLCNGHLKQVTPVLEEAFKHLRGDDVLYRCQSCGTLYSGPPLGHVRDPRKQARFVERELAELLQAAGGTLPAFVRNERGAYVPAGEAAHGHAAPKPAAAATPAAGATAPAAAPPKPAEPEETPEQKRARKLAEAKARKATSIPIPGASGPPPEGETPEQKIARLQAVVAEAKRRKAAAAAGDSPAVPSDITPAAAPPPSPTSGTDSSPSADAHREAAEAQAATGQASAVPLSSATATASPAAGAETAADLAADAPAEPAPKAAKSAKGSHSGYKVPPELQPQPGETNEQKLARLRRIVEEAKRAAGKL